MGGSPQTGRASAPQGRTTERKGGFVGQPLKEKTKQNRAEGVRVFNVGVAKHLIRKVGQAPASASPGRADFGNHSLVHLFTKDPL